MNTKRWVTTVAGVALAAAGTVVPAATASAAPTYDCVVTTTGVPVYDNPTDAGLPYHIVAWVNTGQKITVNIEWNHYRGGVVWGRSDRTYIHENYLKKVVGGGRCIG
ncbi:hypothetical protein GCM10009554_01200 [Kribbella koreensis]|uniref:SH3 domain-containing protein n=1 Tax=Kribbella koreensis TaxID=57909 RepID=A0ABP3ZKQ8_9ACTN